VKPVPTPLSRPQLCAIDALRSDHEPNRRELAHGSDCGQRIASCGPTGLL
jgi:hypothetical protein